MFWIVKANPSPPAEVPGNDPALEILNWKRVSKPAAHDCLLIAQKPPDRLGADGVIRNTLPFCAASPTRFSPAVELKLE